MRQTERDAEIKALEAQRMEVQTAKAELDSFDMSAEVGTPPTHDRLMAARTKLDAMTARATGGGKLSRTETVTVRLDPKLRYLADLAARLHRRTLSSYIEWAIKASLDTEVVRPAKTASMVATDHTIGSEAEYLWDVDDADRFAKLALRYPHLLTHEEQVRWKTIRECPGLWLDSAPNFDSHNLEWSVSEGTMDFLVLRRYWVDICAVAAGTETLTSLPRWLRDRNVEGLYAPIGRPDESEVPPSPEE